MRLTRQGLGALIAALVVIVLDQATKYWIVEVYHLPEKLSVRILPVFSLSMVWNRGVSYGLLTAHSDLARWGLVVFSLIVAGALAVWAARTVRWAPALAIGLIMGGAIGNAVDRARIGQVVDFLDFSGLHFPWVFNVADSAISVGVALLLLDSLLARPQAHARQA